MTTIITTGSTNNYAHSATTRFPDYPYKNGNPESMSCIVQSAPFMTR